MIDFLMLVLAITCLLIGISLIILVISVGKLEEDRDYEEEYYENRSNRN